MKLNDFLLNKSFEHYSNGIDLIRDDFVSCGYERFLWRETLEEFQSREETTKRMLAEGELAPNKLVNDFLSQFSTQGKKKYLFIFPESTSSNFFMAKEIIKRNNGKLIVVKNLAPDDDTVNYIGILDETAKDDVSLMFHVVYTSNVYGNYGGYKMFGYDLVYYAAFCADDDLIYSLEYSQENMAAFYYNGFQTRKDTNPYTIYYVRKIIERLINTGVFKDEFDVYRNLILLLLPSLHKLYEDAKAVAEHSNSDWKEAKTILYSQLVNDGVINTKWKNEASLYKEVKKQYPDAVFQYKPDWLKPQSLDIFIPSRNVGIEYQGIQHYETVEFFGGDEAFKYRQELDNKKRELCRNNSVRLIEWNYNVDISSDSVRTYIVEAGE